MSSIPRWLAASISTTSSEVPAAIVRHELQVLSGETVGPCSQLSPLARMRERRLPRAARAGEEVSLPNLVVADRVAKSPDDGFLAHDLVEVLRAVFPVEGRHSERV